MAALIRGSELGRYLTVVLLGFSLFATSCATAGPAGQGGEAAHPPTREPTPPTNSPGSPEASPADGAIAHAANSLSRELAGDARLASVEVREGNRIIVHWHGPVASKLRDLLARFPNIGVSVEPATCSPEKLNDFASELLASASDAAVNIASVSPDGSYLTLTLDESVKATADVAGLSASIQRQWAASQGAVWRHCPCQGLSRPGYWRSRWCFLWGAGHGVWCIRFVSVTS